MLPYPAFPKPAGSFKNPSQLLNLPPQWSLSTEKIMPQRREIIDSKIFTRNQPTLLSCRLSQTSKTTILLNVESSFFTFLLMITNVPSFQDHLFPIQLIFAT